MVRNKQKWPDVRSGVQNRFVYIAVDAGPNTDELCNMGGSPNSDARPKMNSNAGTSANISGQTPADRPARPNPMFSMAIEI